MFHGKKNVWLTLIAVTWCFPALAVESVQFRSRYDHFTVAKKASRYEVDGRAIHAKMFKDILPLLTAPLAPDCPPHAKTADLIAHITDEGKTTERRFFIKDRLIQSGNQCSVVSGNGIYYLPLHRSFLIGNENDGISIQSPVKVISNGHTQVHIVSRHGHWEDSHPKTELNWEFLGKFINSLKKFRVQYRVSPLIAKHQPHVQLNVGRKTYQLVLVGSRLWGLERPGTGWLEVSGDWAFWFQLDPSIWKDRFSSSIEKIDNPATSTADKQAALQKLEGSWTRSMEEMYRRRLLDAHENQDVQEAALKRLRSKPSWRNMSVFIRFLNQSQNDQLLKQATEALRVRNPKGIVYDADKNNLSQARTMWNRWWRTEGRKHL